ncbi:MAG: IS66 family insertion sequence element accessory protein TnpB [Woeseiaceae bacterium]|nr:IS66 family insertion sequence element accessory protein TnpB [Woeseiaceae bacterium]
MFFPEDQVRVWLYTQATDMRKSFDGLSALVKEKLSADPLSGQIFVFINRKGNYLKALYFDRTGYALWAKRLEQGRFHYRRDNAAVADNKRALNMTELKCILEGIDVRSVRHYKRYRHRSVPAPLL